MTVDDQGIIPSERKFSHLLLKNANSTDLRFIQSRLNKLTFENFELLSKELLQSPIIQTTGFPNLLSYLLLKTFREGRGKSGLVLACAAIFAVLVYSLRHKFLEQVLKMLITEIELSGRDAESRADLGYHFYINFYSFLSFLYATKAISIETLVNILNAHKDFLASELGMEILLTIAKQLNFVNTDFLAFRKVCQTIAKLFREASPRGQFLHQELDKLVTARKTCSTVDQELRQIRASLHTVISTLKSTTLGPLIVQEPLNTSYQAIVGLTTKEDPQNHTQINQHQTPPLEPRLIVYNIFTCRSNYLETASRILSLDQTRSYQREAVRGLLYFVSREPTHNPFYYMLAAKLILSDKNYFIYFKSTFLRYLEKLHIEKDIRCKTSILALFWGKLMAMVEYPVSLWFGNVSITKDNPSLSKFLEAVIDAASHKYRDKLEDDVYPHANEMINAVQSQNINHQPFLNGEGKITLREKFFKSLQTLRLKLLKSSKRNALKLPE